MNLNAWLQFSTTKFVYPIPNDKILESSNLKAFADDKIEVTFSFQYANSFNFDKPEVVENAVYHILFKRFVC